MIGVGVQDVLEVRPYEAVAILQDLTGDKLRAPDAEEIMDHKVYALHGILLAHSVEVAITGEDVVV